MSTGGGYSNDLSIHFGTTSDVLKDRATLTSGAAYITCDDGGTTNVNKADVTLVSYQSNQAYYIAAVVDNMSASGNEVKVWYAFSNSSWTNSQIYTKSSYSSYKVGTSNSGIQLNFSYSYVYLYVEAPV